MKKILMAITSGKVNGTKNKALFFIIATAFLHTLAFGGDYKSYNITSGIKKKLDELIVQKNEVIAAIALDKNNHWVIVTEKGQAYFSKGSYFDGKKNFRKELNGLLAGGSKIEAIAFSPGENWVIVTEKGVLYSSVNGFKNIQLYQQLTELKTNKGMTIQSVAIGPDNFWVVVANKQAYIRDDMADHASIQKTEFDRVVRDANAHGGVDYISFRVKSKGTLDYILIAGTKVCAYPKNNRFMDDTYSLLSAKQRINIAFLDKDDGHAVIPRYNERARAALKDYEAFEVGLRWPVNCDKDGKNCDNQYSNIWERMKFHKVPGVQIAIIKDNKIYKILSYGYRDTKNQKHVLSNTIFSAASISKFVNGIGFLVAEQEASSLMLENYLTWDLHYYATKKNKSELETWHQYLRKKYKKRLYGITIGDLLSHTAGFNVHGLGLYSTSNMPSLGDVMRGKKPWKGDRIQPIYTKRSKYKYSGGGYTLAQAILQQEVGQRYDDFMQEKVLNKLDMDYSSFRTIKTSDREKYLAYGHDKKGNQYSYKECPVDATGGLYTRARDYAVFLLMVMNKGKTYPDYTKSFIADERLKQALMPRTLNNKKKSYYGYGVSFSKETDSNGYPNSIEHTGSQEGYRSKFKAYLNKNTGIVILTNGNKETDDKKGAGALCDEILRSFVDTFN